MPRTVAFGYFALTAAVTLVAAAPVTSSWSSRPGPPWKPPPKPYGRGAPAPRAPGKPFTSAAAELPDPWAIAIPPRAMTTAAAAPALILMSLWFMAISIGAPAGVALGEP